MKTASLFEIKRHTVALLAGRSYIERYRHDGTIRPLDAGGALASVQYEQLPVERICKIEDGVQKDHYIALDPELREILEAPFKLKFMRLNRMLHDMTVDRDRWRSNAFRLDDDFTARAHRFNSLPWYRRIFARV